jgi:glycosyltransferase involved in cell wall biosynthesis
LARILYLYRSPRDAAAAGPTEFAYGAPQLAALGHAVDRIDGPALAALAGAPQADAPAPRFSWSLAARLLPWLAPGIPVFQMGHFASPGVAARLNGYDVVVATTTGLALSAALAKRRGRFAGRLVALAMGILPDTRPPVERRFCMWLLRACTLATLSAAEARFLRARLGPDADIADIGFGVDTGFWSPGEVTRAEPFALAVGNDRLRDWETLVAAWRPEFPRLRIVTRLPLPPLPANVERVAGSLDSPAVDNAGLRELYRTAACVVVPLRQTIQPSGQSVTLQAMACGAPVVLTRTDGLWDDRLAEDGALCRSVPPGDVRTLGAAIAGVLADRAGARAMGERAARHVRACAGLDSMAGRLDAVVRRGAAA